ncbi:EAL domain-containing protein [Marinobacter koreensis]|uniref:EAL domain-containing protein n=2 Tax=Marinobacter koreensis TaxID=335974 RepID=A0ABW0RK36_9GAMM|nr:EAL domain-containing protein [Marinobacter koreensis]MCK7547502.1 EAL domain-containing protein [Marinobacter koreensis]
MARKRDPQSVRHQRGVITLRTLLLIFTGGLLVLVLLSGFFTSYSHFRSYVSEQLAGQARDGATAVGLSLSNAIDGRDRVAAGSLIDSVFDSGRYLSVVYLDNQGQVIVGRSRTLEDIGVPGWFRSLAHLPLPVARAEVVRGWSRLGSVQVVSDPGRAYRDLWRITSGLVVAILVIGGIGLFVLFLTLARVLRPLSALEEQAQALGRREFRRHVTVRSTRELNQVTTAMNQMADDLGHLFEGQAKLIQHFRRVNNEDPVTGLASRSAFDQRLKAEVESEERFAPSVLMLIQLRDFAGFNDAYGRLEGDRLLIRIAGVIREFLSRHAGSFAGRRTGAEFAVYLPGAVPADAGIWCRDLLSELDGIYADQASPAEVAVHAGVAKTAVGVNARELMSAADEALRHAQSHEESACHFANGEQERHHNNDTWRAIISEAILRERFSFWLQPMFAEHSETPLYHQVFSRLQAPEGELKAGVFVPMAERFGLIEDIDRLQVRRVLDWLASRPDQSFAVSIAGASIASERFRRDLLVWLEEAGEASRHLWIGISEQTIHHHRTPVGLLVRALGRLGVPVVVDRFGVGGVPFSYLKNLRFQALRIDNSFIHNIDSHEENRFYLESVVSIAHSRGVQVFASGVETASEYAVIGKLGIDGAMGYHLGRPFAANQ